MRKLHRWVTVHSLVYYWRIIFWFYPPLPPPTRETSQFLDEKINCWWWPLLFVHSSNNWWTGTVKDPSSSGRCCCWNCFHVKSVIRQERLGHVASTIQSALDLYTCNLYWPFRPQNSRDTRPIKFAVWLVHVAVSTWSKVILLSNGCVKAVWRKSRGAISFDSVIRKGFVKEQCHYGFDAVVFNDDVKSWLFLPSQITAHRFRKPAFHFWKWLGLVI